MEHFVEGSWVKFGTIIAYVTGATTEQCCIAYADSDFARKEWVEKIYLTPYCPENSFAAKVLLSSLEMARDMLSILSETHFTDAERRDVRLKVGDVIHTMYGYAIVVNLEFSCVLIAPISNKGTFLEMIPLPDERKVLKLDKNTLREVQVIAQFGIDGKRAIEMYL